MRWLADECLHYEIVERLREAGDDVLSVAESAAQATDSDLGLLALREGRVLLTEDKDFGDLTFTSGASMPGIVLFRIRPRLRHLKWPGLAEAIAMFGADLHRRFTVVEEGRTRSQFLSDL
ncbi:MAG: DUF5615 family PIN-like protein [Proteobacteria bacterium]|nr:DUF5615 family PIN-like protein [Pseudomonadota bacterium]